MSKVSKLPPDVVAYLRRYCARRRQAALLGALGWALALACAWMLLWCLIDRLWPLPPWARLLALMAEAMGILAILYRPANALLNPRSEWLAAALAIEARRPQFAGKLETAVAQALMSPQYRGSDLLLMYLQEQIGRDIAADSPRGLIPGRWLALPWAAAGIVALLCFALLTVSWLDLPRLTRRLLLPLTPLAPATTVRLEVLPGNIEVVAAHPLTITVRAQRLGAAPPRIHLSNDGQLYIPLTMSPAEGVWTYSLASVDRPFHYYITAGDTNTPVYTVDLIQPPAVRQLLFTCIYPAYTRRERSSISNSDGVLEAPLGTAAVLTLVANQPLADATLTFGDQVLHSTAGDAPNARKFSLTIQKDQSGPLRLTGTTGVSGTAPAPIQIRAVPDRAPLCRLLRPEDELRTQPGAIVPVEYQAWDDYGIARLLLEVSVNGKSARQIPLGGGQRRYSSSINLDLATLPLSIGDELAVQIRAEDSAAQQGSSELRHILLTPRASDMATQQNLAELKRCGALAAALVEALESAARSIEETRWAPSRPGSSPGPYRVYQRLGAASEAALLLRQSLLAGIVRGSSSQMYRSLARLLDADVSISALCEHALAHLTDGTTGQQATRGRIVRSLADARFILTSLSAIFRGEQAAAIVADRVALRSAQQAPAATTQPSQRSIERAGKDIADAVAELLLNPTAADLDEQLQRCINASTALLSRANPIDWTDQARQWTQAAPAAAEDDLQLPRRLELAAVAEASYPQGDLIRARDLQLASLAAKTISIGLHAGRPEASSARQQLPSALTAVLHGPGPAPAALDTARAQLRAWAAEPDLLSRGANALDPYRASMAFEASARMVRRDYPAVAQLDANLSPAPAAASWPMQAAQSIDALIAAQQSLLRETTSAAPEQAAALAQKQRQFVQSLATAQQQVVISPWVSDALRSAALLAESAAGALGHSPPDLPTAQKQQADTISALNKGWNTLVRQCALQRLGGVPGIALTGTSAASSIGLAPLPWPGGAGTGAGDEEGLGARGLPPDLAYIPLGEGEIRGYQEALRAYFQAINRQGALPR